LPPVIEDEETEGGAEVDDGDKPPFSPVEIALFAVRSARQNLWLCLLVGLAISGLGSTVVVSLPPTYDVTSKIFVREGGSVTSTLATGRDRSIQVDGKRGIQELILARDNLLSIVREANLVDRWPNTRPLPMRIKDRLSAYLFGPPSRKDMERAFVEMLELRITGEEENESIRFHSQWRDAEGAYDIARLVQRNFLQARAANDLGPIQRAIPFLESQLLEADKAIETAITRVISAQSHGNAAPAPKPREVAPTPPAENSSVVELAALSKELSEARREERTLVEPWRRRIAELKAQMVELSATYTNDHPLIRQQEAKIAAASVVPDELAAVRAKESELMGRLASLGVVRPNVPGVVGEPQVETVDINDPTLAPMHARLAAALRKSDDVAERLESARIELTTAEADFRHRYVVVEEPEVPGKPMSGKRPLFFALVFVAAAVLGFLSGVLREVLKGRMVEPWQVRALGLDLLAEVDLKKLPPPGQS